uniref:Uncharacterized protein n=1 Tax=Tanacetum cinerariifolium TaxID=118510 RepID=A0A6L2K470_TANCI|nr:hypothetical protein [Tanacetum cinerariifolium]
MHFFNSSREINNSFICTFPRVEFPSHDPVVHHSGHDIKRRVEVNVSLFDMHVFDITRDLKVVGHPPMMRGFLRNIKGIGLLIKYLGVPTAWFGGYKPKTSNIVSEDISNEVKKSPDAPLVKELVSDDKLEKKNVFPTVAKIEFVRSNKQENPVRKPVKPKAVNTARPNSAVVNAVRANQVNAVKAFAC